MLPHFPYPAARKHMGVACGAPCSAKSPGGFKTRHGFQRDPGHLEHGTSSATQMFITKLAMENTQSFK